jgi:DNA-binding ferritin-like protein (Dps family)
MIPKIEFRYSFIYQEEIHLPKIKKYDRRKWKKEADKFVLEVKKEWNKISNSVLNYMQKITGLEWKEKKIICYVIKLSESGPISDPLTIPIKLKYKKDIFTLSRDRFIDMLIHELIHNIFIQNENKINNYFEELINKKYKNLSWNTKIHIPVHAIHKKIFDEFFGQQRLKEEIEACSYYPEYKKAWEIVFEEGEDKIIKNLKQFIISNNK